MKEDSMVNAYNEYGYFVGKGRIDSTFEKIIFFKS